MVKHRQKQRQTQNQKVVVNINTETKPKRKYKRKPKRDDSPDDRKPPHQPQMIIYQNTNAPMPITSNAPIQQTPFVSAVQETVKNQEPPINNGIERPQPREQAQTTIPPQSSNPNPAQQDAFATSVMRSVRHVEVAPPQRTIPRNTQLRASSQNDLLLAELKRRTETPTLSPVIQATFQQQQEHSIIDYHHEPSILETHRVKSGIHTFQDFIAQQDNKVQDNKVQAPLKIPAGKGNKLGGAKKLSAEELRQHRASIFDTPYKEPAITKQIQLHVKETTNPKLKKYLDGVNEREERHLMGQEDRTPRYKLDERGIITPNSSYGLKEIKGTTLDSKEVNLDTPLPKNNLDKSFKKVESKKSAQKEEHVKHDKLETELNKLSKPELQAQMKRVGLKYFHVKGKGEKTKAQMKDDLLRLHHTRPEEFSNYK